MSTIVSEQSTTVRETVPRIECTAWCEVGDGHPSEIFAEDQWCRSVSAHTLVSLEDPEVMQDGSRQPAQSSVYASQDPGEAAHVVVVNHQDRAMRLTPDEARDQARLLQHFAWVAEQGEQARSV